MPTPTPKHSTNMTHRMMPASKDPLNAGSYPLHL